MNPGTEGQFGYEWKYYSELRPEHETLFWAWVQPLQPSDFKDKEFLDAGCGMGRNSYWAMKAGARKGVAIDFDQRTVESAKKTLKEFPTCEVRYESIYEIRDQERFDLVFSIGVLHHLADPKQAVMSLVRALKPNGRLIYWVYGAENQKGFLFLLLLLRTITTRLPLRLTRWLSTCLVIPYKIWVHLTPRHPYRNMTKTFTFRHLEAIIFDQLFPKIANYWTREEALALIESLPLRVEHNTFTNNQSWTIICRKESHS